MRKLILAAFLVGVALRAWYFLYPLGRVSFLTVDEAVYGVQSLQILRGERPVFYPAQVYTGSLSAYLSSFLYLIFGFDPIFLKLIPFFFSVIFIWLNYRLAQAVFNDHGTALLTLGLTSLATPFWNNWSSRAGTGYVETSVIGNLMLLVSLRIVRQRSSGQDLAIGSLLLGFLAGLGFWIQPTIIYYLIPSVLYLIISFRGILREKAFYLLPVGFLIGDLPVIIYNLVHDSATTQTLFKWPWGVKTAFFKLILEGMPVLLGVRTSNSTQDFFAPFALIIELVFVLSVSGLVLRIGQSIRANGFSSIGLQGLILATFSSTIVIFLLSTPFNQFSIEPRYLFSLYSTLPLILASFLNDLWRARRVWFVLVIIVFLLNWGLGVWLAGPLSFNDHYRVELLVDHLRERGGDLVISDPALGHRLMFYSDLSILAAIRGGGITEWRLPKINERVIHLRDADNFRVGFVTLVGSSFEQDFEREVNSFSNGSYRKDLVARDFATFFPVRR